MLIEADLSSDHVITIRHYDNMCGRAGVGVRTVTWINAMRITAGNHLDEIVEDKIKKRGEPRELGTPSVVLQ
jgi:hypothetical protein